MATEAFRLGTQIYELAFQSDISSLTALLDSADKKVLDHHDNVDGTTILMVASRDGNTTVVSALLALGPKKLNRDIRDNTGWTALHWAACGATDNSGSGVRPNPTGEVVKLLLNAGLSFDARGTDGETPVDVALKMLNAPALTVFSEWRAAHGGRGVGVRIGAVGNGFVGAKYTTDGESPGSVSAGGNYTSPSSSSTPATAGFGTPGKTHAARHPPHEALAGALTHAHVTTTNPAWGANQTAEAARTPPAHVTTTPPTHKQTTAVKDEPQFPW